VPWYADLLGRGMNTALPLVCEQSCTSEQNAAGFGDGVPEMVIAVFQVLP